MRCWLVAARRRPHASGGVPVCRSLPAPSNGDNQEAGDFVSPVVDCAVRARTETKNDTPRVGCTYFHLRCSRLLLRINPIVERTIRNRACRTNEETSVGILCVPFLLSLPIERGEPGTGTIRRSGCRLFGSCSNGERRTILLRAQQPAGWIFHAQGSRQRRATAPHYSFPGRDPSPGRTNHKTPGMHPFSL